MKLFWRIFLTFWIGAILMIAVVLVADEFWPFSFPGDRRALFKPELAKSVLARAVNTYELHGADAFLSEVRGPDGIHHGSLCLVDTQGAQLANDGTPPPYWSQLACLFR